MKPSQRWIACLTVLMIVSPDGLAQEAVPAAPSTVWSALGIPQGMRKVRGALVNRRGNHPGLEPKIPRKALADPANLASDVPVLKKAAEVKQAEDLKPHKIKAVKYLTEVGCGCYDTDGSITEALLAAMDDCTEDVRLATVEAIAEAASGKCCSNCGITCCCKEAIVKRLAQMAYERDDTGCYLEPSQRVREAAARALRLCCPNSEPVEIESLPEPVDAPPPIQREGAPEEEAREGIDEEGIDEGRIEEETESPEAGADRAAAVRVLQQESVATAPVADPAMASLIPDGTQFFGVIVHSDPTRRAAHVHIEPRDAQLPVGAKLHAYHQIDGRLVYAGQLNVYQSFAGSVNVELTSDTQLAAIQQGALLLPTSVEVEQQPAPVVARSANPVRSVSFRDPSDAANGATPGQSADSLAWLREMLRNPQ